MNKPESCPCCKTTDQNQLLECGGGGYMFVDDDDVKHVVKGGEGGWLCNMCGGSWKHSEEAKREAT